jgi:hypothetical protein
MADNVTAGGFTTAADEIDGVKHQRIKMQFGEDGSATDVSTASPLPVSDAGGSLTVDGTVAVTGVATEAKQDTGNTSLATIAGAVAGAEVQVDVLTMPTVTVTGTVAATNADLATIAGAVSGTEVQVDVLTMPTVTVERVRDTYTHATNTIATSGDNTLVAAPGAGNRLVVKELIVQNESTTTTTAIIKSGATNRWRVRSGENAGLALSFAQDEEWRLGDNEALIVNLSGANSHGYSVRYLTEAV